MASRVTTTLLRNGLLAVAARDGAEPDSILIEDGRIRWIGRSSDAPSTDRVIDLQGSRVVSGLTDAHAHLFMRAQELMHVELGPKTATVAALLERLRRACAVAGHDEWVVSADYSEQFLTERRHPTRAELDAVADGRPILLRRTGGHLSVANSA